MVGRQRQAVCRQSVVCKQAVKQLASRQLARRSVFKVLYLCIKVSMQLVTKVINSIKQYRLLLQFRSTLREGTSAGLSQRDRMAAGKKVRPAAAKFQEKATICERGSQSCARCEGQKQRYRIVAGRKGSPARGPGDPLQAKLYSWSGFKQSKT